MKVSGRDAVFVLGAFLLVVVAGAWWLIARRSAPPPDSDLAPVEEEVALSSEEVRPSGGLALGDPVRTIPESGVFDPLTFEALIDGADATPWPVASRDEPVAVRTIRAVEVEHAGGDSMNAGGSAPSPNPYGEAGARSPAPGAPDIAVIAVGLSARSARVLVEKAGSDDATRWVDVPGQAFGYTVRYATLKGAVIEKDDRTWVLLLGEGRRADGASGEGADAESGPPEPSMEEGYSGSRDARAPSRGSRSRPRPGSSARSSGRMTKAPAGGPVMVEFEAGPAGVTAIAVAED